MQLVSTNPADNYQKVGAVDVSNADEIRQKVAAARDAKLAWKEVGVEERIKKLLPILGSFKQRANEIAKLIATETGKSINESLSEVSRYADEELKWFLDNGLQALSDRVTLNDDESYHRQVYEPYGVAAVLAPWNFPFGMAIWGIFPNLIAGNTVIFKSSEECPLTGKLIEEIINQHNLPSGVFSEVYGDGQVGAQLVNEDIDLIWFTGSTKTGKQLYKVAAEKFIKVVLEMGGSNPCIVFEDINVYEAAPVIFNGRFRHNGQVCSALKRLIVHQEVEKQLTQELAKIIESQTIGQPLDTATDLGSLVAKRQLDLLAAQYQDALDKGAKVISRAKLPTQLKGAYFPATLLSNISQDMRVWKEEVFGPILPVVTFKDENQAISLANDTIYGLGGRVMSRDLCRAERVAAKLDAGSVALNLEARFVACDPFGGYKSSGLGRERGVHGLQELCQIKVIQAQNSNVPDA